MKKGKKKVWVGWWVMTPEENKLLWKSWQYIPITRRKRHIQRAFNDTYIKCYMNKIRITVEEL